VLWADACIDPVLSVEDVPEEETWAKDPLASGEATEAEAESLDASANPVVCSTGTVAVLFVTAKAVSWTWLVDASVRTWTDSDTRVSLLSEAAVRDLREL
jgi:hypothetical protein